MSVQGFASIPNWMFRDQSLSLHAVMVYGALASHQGRGGIYPSRATLAKEARCSVRKVADSLNELEAVGAVTRSRRTSKKGQASSGYTLNPGGSLAEDEALEVEAHGALTTEVGAGGALGEGTQAQLLPLIEEEPLKKNSDFDEFWTVYPRHVARAAAELAFAAAVKRGPVQFIVEGARLFAQDPNLPEEKRFIPHAATWLNQDRWADEREQAPVEVPALRLPAWVGVLGIAPEEFAQRHGELGWCEAMSVLAERRKAS